MNRRNHQTWGDAIRSPNFVVQGLVSVILLLIIGLFIGRYFSYVESVDGRRLNDAILNNIPAYDVSVIIFTFIYSAIVISVVSIGRFPYLLLSVVQAYVVLTALRMLAMWIFPLEPPDGIIPLRDQLVELFFYKDRVIMKDLMFSGHISVLVMLATAVANANVRVIVLFIAIFVSVLLLVQHVHYTVDVVVGAVMGWGVMSSVKRAHE